MKKQRERAKKILDWVTLEDAPNTHGAFSFLRPEGEVVSIRRTGLAPETSELQESGTSQDKMTTVAVSATVASQTTVASSDTVVEKPEKTRARPYKVHRCTLVQHGQSMSETLLYQALWANGKDETSETKIITAGWRTMTKLSASMKEKSCKRAMESLIQKKAIELIAEENTHTRTGRTYRLFSFRSILERRKAAGMEWAVWDKGRRFVRQDGSPLVMQDDSVNKTATVFLANTVPKPNPGTRVNKAPGTGVNRTPVLIGTLLGKEKEETSTSTETELSKVTEALAVQVLRADERAARQLINVCRSTCPDASIQEIVDLIREKGTLMKSIASVRNPLGFLLSGVGSVFEGEGIKLYRRRQAAEHLLFERRASEAMQDRQAHEEFLLSLQSALLSKTQNLERTSEQRKTDKTLLDQVETQLRAIAS